MLAAVRPRLRAPAPATTSALPPASPRSILPRLTPLPSSPFVLPFLAQSIKSYFPNDDDFNWNFGIAKAATGKYMEAEEALMSINNEAYR